MEYSFSGPTRPPLSCGKAKYLVVLLHGAGSSADEIIDLSLDWAPTLNKAEFLAPELPWPGRDMEAGLVDGLWRYLEAALAAKRLKHAQLAVVGFAEAAGLALALGLSQAEPLGAVVAVGRGAKPRPESIGAARHPAPLLLVSGHIGPAAPGTDWRETAKDLQKAGIAAEYLEAPGDYFGLDDQGLARIADYLRAHIAPSHPA